MSTADDTLDNEIKVITNVFRTEQQYQVCGINKSFTLSQCNYWVNLAQSQCKCSHLVFHVSQTMLSSDYMRHQAHITPYMRAILVHWLMEVGHEYMLKRSTVNLAINFVDRMLTQV